MLHRLKKLIPQSWLTIYHFVMAHIAAFMNRYPSNKLHVIGVTGTNGKSTTVQLIGQLLMELGETVGWTTTASFRVADREIVNDKKMTMLGRTQTHKMLREMVQHKCKYAIVETSSQGILQFRHIGINYDTVLFTNLTPEHIEAHGGFDNYKATKLKLFKNMATLPKKRLNGKSVDKTVVINLNDKHAEEFGHVAADRVIGFGHNDRVLYDVDVTKSYIASNVSMEMTRTVVHFEGVDLEFPLVGPFYLENVLAAIAVVASLGYGMSDVMRAAVRLKAVPGRLETFEYNGAIIIVDYAYEPYALEALYKTVKLFSPKRIIHVTGSAGGGRDVARREVIGKLAADNDDIVIVTNEDPYDDDPVSILEDVANSAQKHGKLDGKDLFRVHDRQSAIEQAVTMADSGDVVLITGKGSEPVMAVAGGKKIPSDDRKFVKDIIGYNEVC